MPELPEVETVCKGLNKLIVGKQIKNVSILWNKTVSIDNMKFKDSLINTKIIDIKRRGKYLLFHLNNGLTMISHLRMEGHYQLSLNNKEPLIKHTCVVFAFNDGQELRYIDSRKFGRMDIVETNKEMEFKGLSKLGPEPFDKDFNFENFKKALYHHHKFIKTALLGQTLVAGLGNIYTDEVLWMSKINPLQLTNTLTDNEINILHDNIIKELKLAIDKGGTTIRSFIGADGKQGDFQNYLHVYGKSGNKCERCGTTIVKIKVGQRGTSFCPNCQKLRNN